MRLWRNPQLCAHFRPGSPHSFAWSKPNRVNASVYFWLGHRSSKAKKKWWWQKCGDMERALCSLGCFTSCLALFFTRLWLLARTFISSLRQQPERGQCVELTWQEKREIPKEYANQNSGSSPCSKFTQHCLEEYPVLHHFLPFLLLSARDFPIGELLPHWPLRRRDLSVWGQGVVGLSTGLFLTFFFKEWWLSNFYTDKLTVLPDHPAISSAIHMDSPVYYNTQCTARTIIQYDNSN